jgi:hypothetical protein
VPLTRRLALVLALEGLALTALGSWYAVASLSDRSERAPAELEAGVAVLTGLVLLLVARGADRGRGWARSPAVVLNVFPFPVALTLVSAGRWEVALPLVLLAGTVLYLFATPELRATFRER